MVSTSTLTREQPTHGKPYGRDDLDAARAAFSQEVRLEIIRYLRITGPSDRTRIAEDTSISHGLVAQALNKLKSLGLVTDNANDVDLPARERTYTLDTNLTDRLLHSMARYLLGP
ncbi:ArsR family transcriptional regulator [Paenarthrobacter sp. NPDC058040]|uniref:ArsR family transcriptional regulator n=1 Tax=unclassified Paenarthrobacter TaxID=2634190 RepID=UPI0036DBFD08